MAMVAAAAADGVGDDYCRGLSFVVIGNSGGVSGMVVLRRVAEVCVCVWGLRR